MRLPHSIATEADVPALVRMDKSLKDGAADFGGQ